MKYLNILVLNFLLALIIGAYYSRPVDVDPILKEVKKEQEKKLALQIVEEQRKLNDSVVSTLSWEDFKKLAYNVAKEYNLPPSVIISQAALESARGTSWLARAKNNFLGLGAYNNYTGFGFNSPLECLQYYARLITTDKRYKQAYMAKDDPVLMIKLIKEAGYATSPTYVQKILSMPEFNEYL